MKYLEYTIKYLKESEYLSNIKEIVDKLKSSGASSNNQSLLYKNSEECENLELETKEKDDNGNFITTNVDFENSNIYSFFTNLSNILSSSDESIFLNRQMFVPRSLLTKDQVLRDFYNMVDYYKLVNNSDALINSNNSRLEDSEKLSTLKNFETLKKLPEKIGSISNMYEEKLNSYMIKLNLTSNTGYQSGRTQSTEDKKVDLNVLLNYSEIFIALSNIKLVSSGFINQLVYDMAYKGSEADLNYKKALSSLNLQEFTPLRSKSAFKATGTEEWQLKDVVSNIEETFNTYKKQICEFMDSKIFKKPISENLFIEEEKLAKKNYGDESVGYAKVFLGKMDLIQTIKDSLTLSGDSYLTTLSYTDRFSNSIFPFSSNFKLGDGNKFDNEQNEELINIINQSGKLSPNEVNIFKECLPHIIISSDSAIYNVIRKSQEFQIFCFYLRCALNKSKYFSISELTEYLKSGSETNLGFGETDVSDLTYNDLVNSIGSGFKLSESTPEIEEISSIILKNEFTSDFKKINLESSDYELLSKFNSFSKASDIEQLSSLLGIRLLGPKAIEASIGKSNEIRKELGFDPNESFDYNLNILSNLDNPSMSEILRAINSIFIIKGLNSKFSTSNFKKWLDKQTSDESISVKKVLSSIFNLNAKKMFKDKELVYKQNSKLLFNIFREYLNTKKTISESLYTSYKNDLLKLLRK